MHIQPTSPKTPMNDVDNYVLLLFCHLVIARQTEPSPENIGSYIDSRAFYVSICTSSTVALNRDEGVGPVYRLHMHGLPDRSSFRLEGGDGIQDFLRAALSGYALVEVILLSANHGSHGVFIDQAAGKPEVGLAVFLVIGIHGHGKILQPLFVSLVDCPLLGDMFVQIGDLAPDDAGHDVGDAVVVSDLLMLIPRRGLPVLGGPFPDLVRVLPGVGQEHAAGGAGDNLVIQ